MIETLIEIISLPFMQRALLAGIFIGVLLAALGVFVLIKKMAFFGDGIAHASLAGIAIGLVGGFEPLPVAIIFAVIIALAMYWLERKSRLSSDAVVGIFFTASLAAGVIILSFQKAYQPDLVSFLFGNILAVTWAEAILIIVLSFIILLGLVLLWRRLVLLSLDEDQARLQSFRIHWLYIFLYVALAVAIVLGVKLIGVILVSALLVIPTASVKLLSGSFRGFVRGSIGLSVLMVAVGLLLSFVLDLPAGAVIVLVGFGGFLLSLIFKSVFQKNDKV
jgi:zinc transport system permease protein